MPITVISLTVELDLDSDRVLSAILDDVIEYQEKSPPLKLKQLEATGAEASAQIFRRSTSASAATSSSAAVSIAPPGRNSLAEHSQISDIEKFLSTRFDHRRSNFYIFYSFS